MIDIPRCECHNIDMVWHKDKRMTNSGYWRCVVRKREIGNKANSKYQKTPKGKKKVWKANNSVKGYLRKRRWELKGQRERLISELSDIDRQLKEFNFDSK